jgi:sterol desaturase/sphingolipid hydroxylase (fatty acid hydroxylase superfamily)
MSALGSLFGLRKGRIFGESAHYVDTSKPAGFTALPLPTFTGWLLSAPLLLVNSPNGIWAVISLLIYAYFPYDLSPGGAAAAAPLSRAFFAERAPTWLAVTFGYAGFWHVALYALQQSKRPFIAARPYNWGKTLHNVFWSLWGVLLWVCYENVFCYLWATGRLAYVPDRESLGGTTSGTLRFCAALLGVPAWRAVHFYFSHRLLHFPALYRFVHSLHHRNTDIEPFAGLAMHPVEHLFYFACVLPSVACLASPFALLWNGAHLLLSPAASHSGWEDHLGGGVWHYAHHRYFDVNFAGADVAFVDALFGSFAPSLAHNKADREAGRASLRDDAKSTLAGAPALDFCLYLAASAAALGGWARAALALAAGAPPPTPAAAAALAALAGLGPVAAAELGALLAGGARAGTPTPKSWGPGTLALHVAAGAACTSLPVAWIAWLALQPAHSEISRLALHSMPL